MVDSILEGVSIKTFVFLDLETSSLLPMERPKIMEICLIAVHRTDLLRSSQTGSAESSCVATPKLPRVLDKLTLCVYPNKPVTEKSFQLTGLDNFLLEQRGKKLFDAEATMMLKMFLKRQKEPVCLVAHNGDSFDFRLLRTELDKIGERLQERVLCSDSLRAYAATHELKGDKVSYRLEEIYKRTFGGTVPDAHNAESDVAALIRVMMSKAEIMCNWMDKNAVRFNDIELYYVPSPSRISRKSVRDGK